MPPIRQLVIAGLLCAGLMPQAFAIDFLRGGPSAKNGEFIILSGGPALKRWENLRPEESRHDQWWGNFVRSARLRMEQIRRQHGEDALITWLVFKTGYELRSIEDGEDRVSQVISVRDKESVLCRLVWFTETDQVINYLNEGGHGVDRDSTKIVSFDYFGHSNKHCFTFDYSGEVLGASKVFLHEDDLARLNRGIFARGARCKSWGCHTGESMSLVWRRHTGTRLVGAVGKTDYAYGWQGTLPILSSDGGRWTY